MEVLEFLVELGRGFLYGFGIGFVVVSVFGWIILHSLEVEHSRFAYKYEKDNPKCPINARFRVPVTKADEYEKCDGHHICTKDMCVGHSCILVESLRDAHNHSYESKEGVHDNCGRGGEDTLMKDGKCYKIRVEEIKDDEVAGEENA